MRALIVAITVSASVQYASAWGAAGHEMTGTIAQMYLHPSVLPRICSTVYPDGDPNDSRCHLGVLATWADRIRGIPQYRWAGAFHYVGGIGDWPPSICQYGEQGWHGRDGVNVLGGIYNTTNWLREGKSGGGEATKFLIHFVGDLHQPLHLTARDRGGNGDKVRFHNRITNLHSVWDSRLISNSILDTPHNYTRPLPFNDVENALRGTIYDPLIRSIVWEGIMQRWKDDLEDWLDCPDPTLRSSQHVLSGGPSPSNPNRWDDSFVCPYYWSKPIQALNCELAWPAEFDHPPHSPEPQPIIELDTPQYAGKIRKDRVIEKLIAQAAVRMAAILNGLFMDEEAGFEGQKRLYHPTIAH